MYAKFFKRAMDFSLSLVALLLLSPLILVLTVTGAIAMKGNPFFTQPRPGKKGKDGKDYTSFEQVRSVNEFYTQQENPTIEQGRSR